MSGCIRLCSELSAWLRAASEPEVLTFVTTSERAPREESSQQRDCYETHRPHAALSAARRAACSVTLIKPAALAPNYRNERGPKCRIASGMSGRMRLLRILYCASFGRMPKWSWREGPPARSPGNPHSLPRALSRGSEFCAVIDRDRRRLAIPWRSHARHFGELTYFNQRSEPWFCCCCAACLRNDCK